MDKNELRLCIREAVKTALVVGTILSLINQSDILNTGIQSSLQLARIGLNFVVPFSVAFYSRYKLIRQLSQRSIKEIV